MAPQTYSGIIPGSSLHHESTHPFVLVITDKEESTPEFVEGSSVEEVREAAMFDPAHVGAEILWGIFEYKNGAWTKVEGSLG